MGRVTVESQGTPGGSGGALEQWRDQLAAHAIPEEILTAAPESPYGFSTELFRSRAEEAVAAPPTPSTLRALEALPEGGTVLDVGCGGGAASLPLAPPATTLVGVDESAHMLEAFAEAVRAREVTAGTVGGTWPAVAMSAPAADVVVCHHVFYNVQDLAPFVRELTSHARNRVVVELSALHPIGWMAPLWKRFHGIGWPDGPGADDAVRALEQLGITPGRQNRAVEAPRGGFADRADAIALVRRRLCLPSSRDTNVADALGDRLHEHDGLWSAGPASTTLVTLWWDTA